MRVTAVSFSPTGGSKTSATVMAPIFTCRYGMCGFWGGWGSLRGNYGNAFPRFATERLGPFCREQRPDGRPQAVPVRRQRSLTGSDSRTKGFLPPQEQNITSPEPAVAAPGLTTRGRRA